MKRAITKSIKIPRAAKTAAWTICMVLFLFSGMSAAAEDGGGFYKWTYVRPQPKPVEPGPLHQFLGEFITQRDAGHEERAMDRSRIAFPAPGVPTLASPADDARFGIGSAPAVMTWNAAVDAASYEIELAVDPEFSVTSGPMAVAGTSYDLGSILDQGTWDAVDVTLYWRVRAVENGGATGEWSEVRRFSKSILGRPSLDFPADQARFCANSNPIIMGWFSIDEAAGYQVQIAIDPDFRTAGILPTNEDRLDLSAWMDAGQWRAIDSTLHWRAAGVSGAGVPGPWSSSRTIHKSTLMPPENLAPDSDGRFPARMDPPTFQWDPVDNATSYTLQLLMDQTGELPIGELALDQPRFPIELEDPGPWHDTYGEIYWRVCGHAGSGTPGPWSDIARISKNGRGRIACMGDSITWGDCYVEGHGYQEFLAEQLTAEWGYPAVTINEGVPGAKSADAKWRIEEVMAADYPEIVLIMYGTNDSVDPHGCTEWGEPYGCLVYENLEYAIGVAREWNGEPYLSTIIPTNPTDRFADNPRVVYNNNLIYELVIDTNTPLVDQNDHFYAYPGDLASLYCDALHLTMEGFLYMTEKWVDALR